MACSKLGQCALFKGGIHHSRHSLFPPQRHHNHTLSKLKNSILLVEATKGPVAKVVSGVCQAGAAGALVFGTGYVATLLTTGHRDNSVSPAATEKLSPMMLIDFEHDYPKDDHHLVDAETIIRYLEDSKNLSEKRTNITYFHMISSLLAASMTSVLSFRVFRNKSFLLKVGNRPLVAVGVGVVTPFLMGSIVRSLPRTTNTEGQLVPFGIKEAGHLFYAGTLGLIAAPLYILGGQSMARAAYVTAGSIAGLHQVAKYIPPNALAKLETPLMVAVNAVLVSFLLTLVLRQNHYAFLPLYRFMMHGGLIVYSASYLHALQKMEQSAKSRFYDPVNAAMSLSMNVLNIFGRLAFMLPAYFQVCQDHLLLLPNNQRPYAWLPAKSSANNNHRHHKPGKGDDGSGGGSEM